MPSLIAVSAIVPAVARIFLRGQPKEVVAAVYSAYIASITALAAAALRRGERKTAARILLFACFLFTALLVIYAYLAYRK